MKSFKVLEQPTTSTIGMLSMSIDSFNKMSPNQFDSLIAQFLNKFHINPIGFIPFTESSLRVFDIVLRQVRTPDSIVIYLDDVLPKFKLIEQ